MLGNRGDQVGKMTSCQKLLPLLVVILALILKSDTKKIGGGFGRGMSAGRSMSKPSGRSGGFGSPIHHSSSGGFSRTGHVGGYQSGGSHPRYSNTGGYQYGNQQRGGGGWSHPRATGGSSSRSW